jgi:flagellar assembly protein FliH
LPKIIRSNGVNIDDARPIIMQTIQRHGDGVASTRGSEAAQVLPSQEKENARAIAQSEADTLLAYAREQADALLQNAQTEARNVYNNALRDGFDQGVAQGLTEIGVIKQTALDDIEEAVKEMKAERTRMIGEIEQDVVELVFDIVDKVLSVEMKRSTEWILALIRNSLSQLDSNDTAIMKVASVNYEKISAIAAQLIAAGGRDQKITVVQESAYPPGACILESSKGITDAGVETKIDKLRRAFKGNA